IVAIRRQVAFAVTRKFGDALQWTRKARNSDAAVPIKIAELDAVVTLRIWSTPFVAKSKINRKFRKDSPVVLEIKCRFLGQVGHSRLDIDPSRASIAEQQTCDGIALCGIAAKRLLGRHVLCEIKFAIRQIGLPEVVIENPLLATELHRMPLFNPGERGRVGV